MELKAEVDYQLKKMEHEQEEQRRAERVVENSDNDETPPPAPIISPAALMEISRRLLDLQVQIPRCDDMVPGLAPVPVLEAPQEEQQSDENAANGDNELNSLPDEQDQEQMDTTEPVPDVNIELENSMPIGGDTETEDDESTDSETE